MNRSLVWRSIAMVGLICGVLISNSAYGDQATAGDAGGYKMYTAYNIWLWPSYHMICLNFKGARDRIPVGTEVRNARIAPNSSDPFPGSEDDLEDAIEFVVADTGKKHVIFFTPSYHPKKTIQDYFKMMFTTQPLKELTRGSHPHVALAIKEGVLIQGMNKDQVVASYGPPSERHTRGMDKNVWIYFINRKARLKVYFAMNESTGLEELQQMDLLHGRASRTGLTSYPRPVVAKPVVTRPRYVPRQGVEPGKKDDPEYKLSKIKSLYDKGLITKEEYEEKRKQILDAF